MTNNIAKKIIQGSAVTKAITRLGIEAIKIINIINTCTDPKKLDKLN